MGSGLVRVGVLVLSLVLGVATVALADTPLGAMTAALQKTAAAKTAHVAIVQGYDAPGRSAHSRVTGTLSRGDQDLTTATESGESRRVAVGRTVYQRRPNTADAPWTNSTRTQPATDQAFGSLTQSSTATRRTRARSSSRRGRRGR